MLTIEERVEYLRRCGYNPIHLWAMCTLYAIGPS